MNCTEARERLSPLLDGELGAAEAAEVRAHVAECEGCREHHAELAALVSTLRGAPSPALPEGFAAEVLAALPSRRRGGLLRLVPLAGLAAAALLVAVVLSHRSRSPDARSPVTETARGPAPGASEGDGPPRDIPFASAPAASVPDGAPAESVVGDSRAGLTAGAPAPVAEEARASRSSGLRYIVAGGQPDAAAGMILAEIDHRRRRGGPPPPSDAGTDDTACVERVVAGAYGEPRSILLCLTPDEVRYVLAILDEQGGLRVTRRNGGYEADRGKSTAREAVEFVFESR
jgi:hypothetical protein